MLKVNINCDVLALITLIRYQLLWRHIKLEIKDAYTLIFNKISVATILHIT